MARLLASRGRPLWSAQRGFSAASREWNAVGREPVLFTPGPLTTSATVKQAMLVDYGSRDGRFTDAVATVREGLLRVAGTSKAQGHECVIMQGAGTMAVEAMLGCAVPRSGGRVLLLINGSYGRRQDVICNYMGIDHECMQWPDEQAVSVEATLERMRKEKDRPFTHVSVVHHETTAGVINPLEDLVRRIKAEFPGVSLLVDSMSGFGVYDLQMSWGIDWAVSSANKCIEGVPGFSYVMCSKDALVRSEGNARSLALDLYDQWKYMETTKQFRFTPPTHSVLAFRQALREFDEEGGVAGRAARYRANYDVLKRNLETMGFKMYVPEDWRSFLILTILMPQHPNFKFQTFYDALSAQGFVIYPGKVAQTDSFRLGTIGRIFPKDCELLCAAIAHSCREMGVPLPLW